MLKRKYKLLSYLISEETPIYGGGSFQIRQEKQIKKGDSSNTFRLDFISHSGTHIDTPQHYFNNGRPIEKYNINELIFNRPHLINLPKNQDELITKKDLRGLKKCDILLIKTGFFKFRQLNIYIFHNPGFSHDAAKFIRENYPDIRAIGIDTISISGYQNRTEGRLAHKALLTARKYNYRPVLLIEDMDLSGDCRSLKKIYVAPLFVKEIDSAPCTIIGEF